MLDVSCPIVTKKDSEPCLVVVHFWYGSLEKICASRIEALIYVKEISKVQDVKGFSIR